MIGTLVDTNDRTDSTGGASVRCTSSGAGAETFPMNSEFAGRSEDPSPRSVSLSAISTAVKMTDAPLRNMDKIQMGKK